MGERGFEPTSAWLPKPCFFPVVRLVLRLCHPRRVVRFPVACLSLCCRPHRCPLIALAFQAFCGLRCERFRPRRFRPLPVACVTTFVVACAAGQAPLPSDRVRSALCKAARHPPSSSRSWRGVRCGAWVALWFDSYSSV